MSDPKSVSPPPLFARPPRYPQSLNGTTALDLLQSADQAVEALLDKSSMAEHLREEFEDRKEDLLDAVVPLVVDRLWTEYIRRVGRAEAREDWGLLREAKLVGVEGEDEDASVTLKELPEEAFEDPTGHIREFARGAINTVGVDEWARRAGKRLVSESSSKVRRESKHPKSFGKTKWSPEEAQNRILERAAGDEDLIRKVSSHFGKVISSATLRLVKKWAEENIENLDLLSLELLLGVREADSPTSRRDTPEFAPDPFQGDDETAGIIAGPFSFASSRTLAETPDDISHEGYSQEWGSDSTGHPIRVEELSGQYSGRVTFRVQAYGEPDPTTVDAKMGWAMLQGMGMEEVWLHIFLLVHASAPGRRGDRKLIRIPRKQIERLPMGFRSRNRSKWDRARKIKEHIDRLRSVFVQFQNVKRHGDKLQFRRDMNATPLWNLRMVAEGEKDLFTGEEWAEWHLEAREGLWAKDFLHTHGSQWAPLPKEWFEQIDRRGNDWGERLAVLLLFLFRTNRKRGGRVKLSAERMLQACGVDLSVERDSSERYDLKQKLSSALEDLYHNYGMRVQDENVNMSEIDGRSYWTSWKNQTVTIDPPEQIDQSLFSGDGPERPPLPDTRPGRWSKKQIERLLGKLGWTQTDLADKLPVQKQSVSHYLNDRRTPSDEVRTALDRIQARYL